MGFKQPLFLLLLLLTGCTRLLAQTTDSVVLAKHIPIDCRLMSTDHLGNIYAVRGNNLLVRYNSSGDSTGVFNEIRKGKISQIDATNPLRILLFFSDYNQIVVLDNMLSRKNLLKLNTIGLFKVTAIANSADGTIWVYDAAQGNLLKVDDKGGIKLTTPLRNVKNYTPQIGFMVEEERVLYTVDSRHGIDKFDLYGFYISSYPFLCEEIQWFNHQFVYFRSPHLISYNTQSLQEKKWAVPTPENIQQVRAERGSIFVLRQEGVDIYKY